MIFIGILGGRQGKQFALLIGLATLVTFGLHVIYGVEPAQRFVLVIDLSLLGTVGFIAVNSSVHWPIWFCGFHAITVATGMARFIAPSHVPSYYTNFAAFWSVPALGVVVAGVWLDYKAYWRGNL